MSGRRTEERTRGGAGFRGGRKALAAWAVAAALAAWEVAPWALSPPWPRTGAILAAPQSSSVAPLRRLLDSGRLPPERLRSVVKVICERGDAADLADILERAMRPDEFSQSLRIEALEWLAEATRTRKVEPAAGRTVLETVLETILDAPESEESVALRRAAVRLAGLWNLEGLIGAIRSLTLAPETDAVLRATAVDALVDLGGDEARATLARLAAPERSAAERELAIVALAALDPERAAALASELLAAAPDGADPDAIVAAFLDRQGGSAVLAAALAERQPPADVARRALRALYARGRADAELSLVLEEASGLDARSVLPEGEELDDIVAEVLANGDSRRGEEVFHRPDLSCLGCHSVGGAGGDVGPDLSAVGASSPIIYLLESILQPERAVKEEFRAVTIVTTTGSVSSGILVDSDGERLLLKEATGAERSIPRADVLAHEDAGSLMPKGLSRFLSRTELVDLVRFLSELGKPDGRYAIRAPSTIQRWRLRPASADCSDGRSEPSPQERTVYARFDGTLPIVELARAARSAVLCLEGLFEVSSPGVVELVVGGLDGLEVRLDGNRLQGPAPLRSEVTAGRHSVTLRVDTTRRGEEDPIRLELVVPESSDAAFSVVGGR